APRTRRMLTEFEHLLGRGGCPACAYLAQAESSFFSWFQNENYSSAEVQAQVRAGMGMCPVHSRRVVDEIGAGPITTVVAREALAGAIQHVRGEARVGSCAACDTLAGSSEYVNHLVIDALHGVNGARRYGEHAGMCLPHLVGLAPMAEPAILKLVGERLLTSLGASDGQALASLLAGVDGDARRRVAWRERLPESPPAGFIVDGVREQLAAVTCPVCLSAGLSERRYLRWFGQRSRSGEQSLGMGSDPGELCSAHTHDVTLADRAAAEYAVSRKRAATMGYLERLLDQLALLPPATGRRRRSGTGAMDRVRGALISPHQCPVCRVRDGTESRQLELLIACLGLAPVRRQYEESHGLCVRHAMRVTADGAARLTRRHIDARLSVLAWEVNERQRKYGWAYRHEEAGPEQDAWLRGFVQIDGRVLAGGPAAAIRETEAPD
ncbi:MAG: hypothetical protein ACRDPA_28745, partial [Solirubrobacteraceae bacterium]